MEITWEDSFTIQVKVNDGTVIISANKNGLLSLAAQLTSLAQAPPGSHIHYDAFNSLEEGSAEMIIEHLDL